jgi:hypothetical protein
MAMFDTANAPTTPANTAAPTAPKKIAQTYANIGLWMDIQQDDGTVEKEFISMPLGIALDIQQPMVSKSKNPSWNHKVEIKNWILATLQKDADKLTPGETEMVTGLSIQLLRRNLVGEQADNGVNPMMAQLEGLKLVG